jgi:hypothetical protein
VRFVIVVSISVKYGVAGLAKNDDLIDFFLTAAVVAARILFLLHAALAAAGSCSSPRAYHLRI